jgi:tetratricopeptide (TPR) repeat protein
LRLIDPADPGTELASLPAPSPIAFSRDGTLLVTGREAYAPRVWDLRALREQLADLRLDLVRRPYPPATVKSRDALRVEVLPAPKVSTTNEQLARAHFERALVYAEVGNLHEALKDFDKAEELNPNLQPTAARHYFLRSKVYGHAGRLKAAEDWALGVALTTKAAAAALEKSVPNHEKPPRR